MGTVKELILKINAANENIKAIDEAIKRADQYNRLGLLSILSKRKFIASNKLKGYLLKFSLLGQGTILSLKFKVITENEFKVPPVKVKYYINITKEEGKTLLLLWAKQKKLKVEILEIEEILTSNLYKVL